MTSPREEIAAAISAEAARTPRVPADLPPFDAERAYVAGRVSELLAIWRSHGLDPVSATVICAPALAEAVSPVDAPLVSVDGVDVIVLADPRGSDAEAGTFSVDIDAEHPAAIFVRTAVGIAFPNPIDPAHLETRWVLQEVDGMSAGDAAVAAERL